MLILTNKALSPCLGIVFISDKGNIRGADDHRQDPDQDHHQLGVPGGQTGGQGVQDAEVPEKTACVTVLKAWSHLSMLVAARVKELL